MARCMLAAVIATGSGAMVFAQPTIRPAAPVGDAPKALAEVQYVSKQSRDRGVTFARMSNGMTVIVQENRSAPVATVRCYVHNTGSAYEGKNLGAGLSHVLEHLLAGGTTTRRTENQIKEILDSLGGHTNAYTTDDVTCFHIDCPAHEAPVAIELIAQNMQFSVIPANEYTREMGVVQRELEMGEADRSRVMYNTMKQLIYTEHPARHPTIGYLPVVQQIKREEILAFYKDRYVPQNLVFVVVGDVEPQRILNDVLAGFKTFQRTTERRETLPVEPEQASPRSTRLEMEGPTTHLCLAWPTVPLQDPDLYPLDLASFILTTGDSSRLVKKLKIEKPLVLNVNSTSFTPGYVKGWFQVQVECDPKHVEQVRQLILAEMQRLIDEPVPAAELAKAKRQKAAEHVFGQQTVENQAERLAESYRATGDPLFDTHYVAGIQKVTAAQIQAALKKYVRPDRLNTVRIEPLGSSGTAKQDDSQKQDDAAVQKTVLPNGLTVLFRRQRVLPLVTMQAYVKAGVIADQAETAGLAGLTTEMLEHGTQKYRAEEIAEHFDAIGGTLVLNSQHNTSYVQALVLKQDALSTLDYLHQMLFHPTFPAEEFANVQQIRLGRIAARKANPQTEILDFWTRQLPGESPYSRTALGDAAAVAKLTREDCATFHKTYFVPNNMVLAIFGDVDPAEMLPRIEATFGKVPKKADFRWPTFAGTQASLKENVVQHLQNQKKNTAMVLMSFPTVNVREERTRSTLDVLDAVLTGGGSAGGRLHDELRGEQLVYYIFGIQMTGFAPGHFVFLAQTRPESVPEVVSRVRQNLDRIAKEGVADDELVKIKNKLLASHAMKATTPAERAFQTAVNELYGLGYDYEKGYRDRIQKVTSEDLRQLVKQHFQAGVVVTTAPTPAPKLSPGSKSLGSP